MRNLKNSTKPAAFLDRDGVICEYVDYLHKVEDFKLRSQVGAAIRLLNENNFWVFVITNQPMIAKGLMTLEDLNTLHNKMKTELTQFGAQLDDIMFCPHSPDGTLRPWNTHCQCRKPQTGMIEQLLKKYQIDLKNSLLIGDTWRDIECAKKINIKSFGVMGGAGFPYPQDSTHFQTKPDFLVSSLYEAVNTHLQSSNFVNRAP